MPTINLPPGLLEAALDGQGDALVDLAHYLLDIGDPRGADLLWHIQYPRIDGLPAEIVSNTVRRLKAPACPRCGVVCHPGRRTRIWKCTDGILAPRSDGGFDALTSMGKCGWIGKPSELLRPLIKD